MTGVFRQTFPSYVAHIPNSVSVIPLSFQRHRHRRCPGAGGGAPCRGEGAEPLPRGVCPAQGTAPRASRLCGGYKASPPFRLPRLSRMARFCARKGAFRYNDRVVMESQAGIFRCRRCGACCRVPGYVRVSDEDVVALAGLLGMTPEAFAEEHTELSPGRTGLVLKGRPEAPCRFLTAGNLCRVHAARPRQCRDYPARWRSADIEAVCRAARSEEWI